MMRVLDNVIDDWYEVQRSKGFIVVVQLNLRFFSSMILYPNNF